MRTIKQSAVRAETSKITYLSGEELRIKLFFTQPSYLAEVTNISIDLHKIERGRNQFSFGFGAKPSWAGSILEVKQKLPNDFSCGLYVIGGATLCLGDVSSESQQYRVVFEPIFLAVQTILDRPFSKQDIEQLISNAEIERYSYINHEFQTKQSQLAGVQKKSFSVLVFGVGCLLHSHQQLEGFVITPLGLGMSHRRLHEIVNSALSKLNLEQLRFDPEMEKQFESASPTFLVSYPAVVAVDYIDALDYCRSHAAYLFELLGLDRGQKPREFASFASELGSNQRWHMYQQPWYKGNLICDFNPVSTPNLIERALPKLQAIPFLSLLIKTYSDATAEENQGFALLRYWSVMELLAGKYVQQGIDVKNPDGSLILKSNGKPENTGSKHGGVYHYILSSGHYSVSGSYNLNGIQKSYLIGADLSHPGCTQGTELISLWDMVRAAYAVRNAIAHEGQFDLSQAAISTDSYQQLAARLIQDGYASPVDFIQNQARLNVMIELNKP